MVMGEVPRWLISLNMPTLTAGDQVKTKPPRSPFYLPALLALMCWIDTRVYTRWASHLAVHVFRVTGPITVGRPMCRRNQTGRVLNGEVAFRCALEVRLFGDRRAPSPSPGSVLGTRESSSLNLQALYYACSGQRIAWEFGADGRGDRGGQGRPQRGSHRKRLETGVWRSWC